MIWEKKNRLLIFANGTSIFRTKETLVMIRRFNGDLCNGLSMNKTNSLKSFTISFESVSFIYYNYYNS